MGEWIYLENEWTFVNLAFVKEVSFDCNGKFFVEMWNGCSLEVKPKIYPSPFVDVI